MQKRTVFVLLALVMANAATTFAAQELTLKECFQKAADKSNKLRASSYATAAAREQIGIAEGALLPKIDFQAAYTVQQHPQGVTFGTTTMDTQDPRYATASISINDTLYDFGKTKARSLAASKLVDAARFDETAVRQELFLEIARAYYGILQGEKMTQAAADEVSATVLHLKTAQALFDAGSVTRNDVLQAEVRLASAQQRELAARNGVANGWVLLNYLTGEKSDFRAELLEDQDHLTPLHFGGDISHRAELQALKERVSASEHAVEAAKASYKPELFVRLGADYQQNSKVVEPVILAATIGIRGNLFDGGIKGAQLSQAALARSEVEERLKDAEHMAQLELEAAGNDLGLAGQRIELAKKAVVQAAENVRITGNRYREKVGNATEVVDALALLTQARSDYFYNVYQFEIAKARVQRAMGIL